MMQSILKALLAAIVPFADIGHLIISTIDKVLSVLDERFRKTL